MERIRNASDSDIPFVRELISFTLKECVIKDDKNHKELFSEICKDFDWWKDNKDKSLFLVYEKRMEISGIILVKEFWNLSGLFVKPKEHMQGIGKKLTLEAINLCKARSPKGKLMLNSSIFAQGFYEKIGFIKTGEGKKLPGGCVPFEYRF